MSKKQRQAAAVRPMDDATATALRDELFALLHKEVERGCTNQTGRRGMASITEVYAFVLPMAALDALRDYPRRSIDERRKAIWAVLKAMQGPMPESLSAPPKATLSGILLEERRRSYDNGSIRGGLQKLEREFVRHPMYSPANLLRFYPALAVVDRKNLAALAIKQLTGKAMTPTETIWLHQFRANMGVKDPNAVIALSTPGEISAEDWAKM